MSDGTAEALRERELFDQDLAACDAERDALDLAASAELDRQQASYREIREALPEPPRVSAAVTVPVALHGDRTRALSAFDLADLRDPDRILAAWRGMTVSDRERLLADAPLVIGNLEGIPLRDRDAANRITALEYRAELAQRFDLITMLHEQPGYAGLLGREAGQIRAEIRSLDALLEPRDRLRLVSFNPLRDSIVGYHGPIDSVTGGIASTVQHIGVLVPGTNSSLASFPADMERSENLQRTAGPEAAFFTWHGGRMPEFDLGRARVSDAAVREFAETAGPRLAGFLNGMHRPPGAAVTPIGHSYGAAVLGRAELLGARADRVLYVAPAGIGHGAESIADFPETANAPHFVLQARNDGVVGWNQGSVIAAALRLGHGIADPLASPGITRLETGFLDAANERSGTIESVGGFESHSSVFRSGSTSEWNIAAVVIGDEAWLFAPDGPENTPESERRYAAIHDTRRSAR